MCIGSRDKAASCKLPLDRCDYGVVVRCRAVGGIRDGAKAPIQSTLCTGSFVGSGTRVTRMLQQVARGVVHIRAVGMSREITAIRDEISAMRSLVAEAGDQTICQRVFKRQRMVQDAGHTQVGVDSNRGESSSNATAFGVQWSANKRRLRKAEWIGILRRKSEDWGRRCAVVLEGWPHRARRVRDQSILLITKSDLVSVEAESPAYNPLSLAEQIVCKSRAGTEYPIQIVSECVALLREGSVGDTVREG